MKLHRIQEQPRLPPYTKNHAIIFLHACYWDVEVAKNALRQYATIRASAPEIFDNRDPENSNVQVILNAA